MNEKYKMLCLDLDGTLLDSTQQISRNTIQFLKKIEKNGIVLVVTTGRAVNDARYYAKMISKNAYFVALNGSIVGVSGNEKIISSTPMKQEAIDHLLEISNSIGWYPALFTSERIIVNHFREFRWHIKSIVHKKNQHLKNVLFIPGRWFFSSYVVNKKPGILKASFSFKNKQHMDKTISILKHDPFFETAQHFNFPLEITEKGMNKCQGIKVLMDMLKINQDDIR